MLPVENVLRQIKAASSIMTCPSEENVTALLEANGFKREIAGTDFDKAVKAFRLAETHQRGILVLGEPGAGKTLLLKTLHAIRRKELSRFVYTKGKHALEWLWESSDFYMTDDIYLDEIGAEEIYHDYGNVCDVVGDFIQRFHARHEPKARFFGTTNLGLTKGLDGTNDGPSIQLKYGSRVVDRLLEMCVVVKFDGKSKRERIFVQ